MEKILVTKVNESKGVTIVIRKGQGRRSLSELQMNEYQEGEKLAEILWGNLPTVTLETLLQHLIKTHPSLARHASKTLRSLN